MSSKGAFIIVGENIHCTRIRLTAGKYVETAADGSSSLLFKDDGKPARLPIPGFITGEDNWKSGKVRHVAVAVYQGLYGSPAEREAGTRYVQAMAREQQSAGAWFLDLNVDEFSTDRDEKIKAMQWAAAVIQQVVEVPLSIDSSDPQILKAGLEACDPSKGKPMVNSVSLERAGFIPVAAAAGACIIAGATGADRMPEGVEDRLANIEQLMKIIAEAGFVHDEVYLDPLVYPASVDVRNARLIIDTIKALRKRYGDQIHFAPGLSNVSYGFPGRGVINQVFARLCREAGCDGGIVDPVQINDRVMDSIDYGVERYRLARELLRGNDEFGMQYITAMKEGTA
ncbi:MAG: hypothetical protein EA384_14660 [Spirochaetaceae bacterium]|nr:MAG: hypothetical protein EA384_14660 [Spirochaetaceae bacterium]